jgi:hypothetical protein
MMQPPAPPQQQGAPAQQGGGAPPGPGGQPAGPAGAAYQDVLANLPTGPHQSTTPEEQWSRAEYLANQIMGMSESQKDSTLIQLKKKDPSLHPIVKSIMDDKRRQLQRQGGEMLQAQMFGKTGGSRKKKRSVLLDE